jgi:hypothetical protein
MLAGVVQIHRGLLRGMGGVVGLEAVYRDFLPELVEQVYVIADVAVATSGVREEAYGVAAVAASTTAAMSMVAKAQPPPSTIFPGEISSDPQPCFLTSATSA